MAFIFVEWRFYVLNLVTENNVLNCWIQDIIWIMILNKTFITIWWLVYIWIDVLCHITGCEYVSISKKTHGNGIKNLHFNKH